MKTIEERRREILERAHQEIEKMEQAARERMKKKIDPIVDKVALAVKAEVRRTLEGREDELGSVVFRKRDFLERMRPVLESLFEGGAEDEEDQADAVIPAKTTGEPVSDGVAQA